MVATVGLVSLHPDRGASDAIELVRRGTNEKTVYFLFLFNFPCFSKEERKIRSIIVQCFWVKNYSMVWSAGTRRSTFPGFVGEGR